MNTTLNRKTAGDTERLADALKARLTGEVRFDAGSRAVYSADASNYRQIPIGVVIPKTVEDIVAAVEVCRAFGAPILPRGGGTSQCGQCVNIAVVIDTSKYLNRVLEIDPRAMTAQVEPGTVCDTLRDAAEQHALTFGPDPATHSRCTLGGMIGNNSCGAHSVMAGKTAENIEALEILTYDGVRMRVGATSEAELEQIIREGGRRGEIYRQLRALRDKYADLIRARFPRIKRRVSGYNLDQLLPENGFNVARALVGSEGTCAITLRATTRLVESPCQRVILVLGFRDIYRAGDAIPHILPFGPIATEGLDERIIGGLRERGLRLGDIGLLPPGRAWIMIEFGADTAEAAMKQAQALVHSYEGQSEAPSSWLITDPAMQARIWTIRETGASATTLSLDPAQPDPVIGWEDAAVDPLRLGDYLREFQALVDRHGYQTSLYGHFGDGCIHARITFDLRSQSGVATWRHFLRDAAELVVKYGGSLSGEHGDGQAKAEFLPVMYGEELMQAFREFKAIWDPLGKMNPGKLIDPYRADENLRLGPDYHPQQPSTRFSFVSREGAGFTRAIERCVGMGKCRSRHGGVMCPSYRVTGEERYSTRGRARLFAEMLRGETVTGGWQSDEVREALDLCLACKGCKNDCPTHTDMASYKAEFLSHYYEGRLRPRQAYSMGLIQRWARIAALAPGMVNFLMQMPGLSAVAKFLAGIAQQRNIPRFAKRTFRQWFFRRAAHPHLQAAKPRRVILWADTFNNHFHPASAAAAVEVLEAAGYEVVVPRQALCCGRPLYDFGMLDIAKRKLRQVLDALEPDLRASVPIVGLEPACLAVFRDEMLKFFPDDELARKLSNQVHLFSDFLLDHAQWQPPQIGGDALVHGHCHQKALFGMDADIRLLKKLGVEATLLDAGCCGMSGSFGFNPRHHELSIKAGEAALLPAVRHAPADTMIIASGYSCREQIAQSTDRRALHIAEVAALALHRNRNAETQNR
ncbi:MAG TPA: FAD-binding and (Fe-S)-binding domain-containing protein [Burkholderiales bacterium]|nr:FAD-binding and (Fe-S)-binding domain-containing protein [Burkholderiales bacterium]